MKYLLNFMKKYKHTIITGGILLLYLYVGGNTIVILGFMIITMVNYLKEKEQSIDKKE